MGLTFLLLSLLSSLFGAEAFVPSTSFSSRGITELKMSAPEIEVVSNPSKEFLDEKGGKCRLTNVIYVVTCMLRLAIAFNLFSLSPFNP